MTKRQREAALRRAPRALKDLPPFYRKFWLKSDVLRDNPDDSNLIGAILAFSKDLEAETERWKAAMVEEFKEDKPNGGGQPGLRKSNKGGRR